MGALGARRGLTRSQAVAEAVRDWTLKEEAALSREARLDLEGRMREDFGGRSGDIRPARRTSVRGVVYKTSVTSKPLTVETTELKARRLRIALTQTELA